MRKPKTKARRYEYTMHVTETVESRHVVKSNKPLSFDQLARKTEKARVAGKLKFVSVSHVETWCESAHVDGKSDREAISPPKTK